MSNEDLEVTCADVKMRLDAGDEVILVDCREPEEHAIAAIESARLIPLGELVDRVAELGPPGDGAVVVHCHHGGRSLQAAQWLRGQGYAAAVSMAGGIDRWAVEIDPNLQRY